MSARSGNVNAVHLLPLRGAHSYYAARSALGRGDAMSDVRCERRGAALWITIDREDRRNALNEDVAFIADGVRLAQATGRFAPWC
jgi:hypothetical protein